MIGAIYGKIESFRGSRVYIDTGGVIYEIYVPLNVLESLHKSFQEGNTDTRLYIHHQFFDDGQRLYGFFEQSHRELFRSLQDIKGFGSSLALSILSHLDPEGLLALCEKNDVAGLKKIPRIGKTTAESLIFEINRRKDKFRKLLDSESGASVATPEDLELEDAKTVLLQLGYKESQIDQALKLMLAKYRAEKTQLPADAAVWVRAVLGFIR